MAILFKEDWLRYPTAIMDDQTKNRSAVELAAKLRVMGIENYGFFLALHNPALQGIDPFSPLLSPRTMAEIAIEIKNNPWYYFREIAKAPALSGSEPIPVEFNRANVAMWWCFFNHIITFVTQPRQTGKSFSADHMATYLMNFRCTNTQFNLLTKDDKLRAENIKRLKDIYDELPSYLKFKTREDANNTEEITIMALGNTYKTHVPQAAPKKANNQGRGLTTPVLFVDESPFQVNIDISLPAAVGAMGAAVEAAKRNEEPYGILLTTTAGKKDEKEGKYIFGMIEKSAPFTERFYDCQNEAELRKFVEANGRGNYRTYICFSYLQLGKDDAWMRERVNGVDSTPDQINRDFFNVWTSGTSSSPLSTQTLEKIANSERDPLHHSIDKTGYMLRWYLEGHEIEEFMRSEHTVAGIDTSDAVGNDDISLILTHVKTGATVAVGSFNETNLITFAMYLVDLIAKYPNMTLNIERRSSGVTIIDYLLLFLPQRGIDPFRRLFNWVVNDPDEHKDRYAEARLPLGARSSDIYTRCKKYFGFATSGGGQTSRTELYSSTLMNAAKRNCEAIYDRGLSAQIRGLTTRNGRIDHAQGEHDDLVIGWLMSHWFLTMAKNLSFYGIDPSKILVVNQATVAPSTPEEQLNNFLQLQVRQRINTLFELMVAEQNEFMLNRYELELRQLDRQLVLQDGENFSLAMFLNEMREKRKKNRAMMNHSSMQDRSYVKELGYSDGVVSQRQRMQPNTYVM